MKVAIQYSGHLRFIQDTYPKIKEWFIANEEIEFYFIIHTWDESLPEDIEYMKNVIKPARYFIDKQKNFERHPYQLMNVAMTHEEYKNEPTRLEWNRTHPNDQKRFFEKPSEENNYAFDKDLEVFKCDYYSHYPFNTLSLFYSMHQVSVLTNSFAQENNITFDFVVRMRSDLHMQMSLQLNNLDKERLYLFDAAPHRGEQGKYTVHDQFAISNPSIMTIYNDIFVYLPCYYAIVKLDWISEILMGFHLQYNNIPIIKIPRYYTLLRYADRVNPQDGVIRRPTK
uniref:Uncharacterized protein n=1 Tax=viral metagenome TaxID=1070528 RepID=A0A6C0ARH7_9ZZZZ